MAVRRKRPTRSRQPRQLRIAPTAVQPLTIVDRDRNLTALDRLVELLRVGVSEDFIGGAVGLRPAEVRGWIRRANSLHEDYRHGRRWPTFTDEEQAMIQFAIDAAGAATDWVARQEAMLEQLARGGLEVTEVREESDGSGNLTLRMERRSKLAPDARVLTWRLERRLPALYGRRAELLVHGDDTSGDDDVRARLIARLSEVAERLELPPGPPT